MQNCDICGVLDDLYHNDYTELALCDSCDGEMWREEAISKANKAISLILSIEKFPESNPCETIKLGKATREQLEDALTSMDRQFGGNK